MEMSTRDQKKTVFGLSDDYKLYWGQNFNSATNFKPAFRLYWIQQKNGQKPCWFCVSLQGILEDLGSLSLTMKAIVTGDFVEFGEAYHWLRHTLLANTVYQNHQKQAKTLLVFRSLQGILENLGELIVGLGTPCWQTVTKAVPKPSKSGENLVGF